MKTHDVIIYLLFVCFIFFSCTAKQERPSEIKVKFLSVLSAELPVKDEFSTERLKLAFKQNGFFMNFYHGVNTLYKNDYFIFCDRTDSLIFFDLNSKALLRRPLRPNLYPHRDFLLSVIKGNELVVLHADTKELSIYQIDSSLNIKFSKKYNVGNFLKKSEMINCGAQTTNFDFQFPTLYLNYYKGKSLNYIDKYSVLFFSVLDSNHTRSHAISYPENYHIERVYNSAPLFTLINDTTLAYCFMGSDKIGVFNTISGISTVNDIEHECKFVKFDKSKEQNLAYVQKYSETNEGNKRLLPGSNGEILVFKQLQKSRRSDSTKLQCFIFDQGLLTQKKIDFKYAVCPLLIFAFKKGFLLFSESIEKAYYYEVN
jgi:hypothetical protein